MTKTIRFSHQTAYLLSSRILNVALAGLALVIVPRTLGPRGMGVYLYWLSIFHLMFLATDPGTLGIISRVIPVMRLRSPLSVYPLLKKLFLLKVLLILLAAVLIMVIKQSQRHDYLLVLAGAGFFSLAAMAAYFHYGLELQAVYGSFFCLNTLLRIIFICTGFLLLGDQGIIYGLLLLGFIMFLIFWAFALRRLDFNGSQLEKPFSSYLRLGLFLHLGTVGFIFINRSVILQAKYLNLPFEEIGILGLAMTIAVFTLQLVTTSVSESSLPTLVKYHETADSAKFQRLLRLSWRYTCFLGFGLAGLVFLGCQPWLGIILGPRFARIVPLLRLLLLATIILTWQEYLQRIMIVFKKNVLLFVLQVLGAALFWGLLPVYGHSLDAERIILCYLATVLLVTLAHQIIAARLVNLKPMLGMTLRAIIAATLPGIPLFYIQTTNMIKSILVLGGYAVLFIMFSLKLELVSVEEIRNHFRPEKE